MVHRESLDDHAFRQVHFWNFNRSDCKFAWKKITNVDDSNGTTMEITKRLREIIRICWNARTNPAARVPASCALPKFYDMVVVLFRSGENNIIKCLGF